MTKVWKFVLDNSLVSFISPCYENEKFTIDSWLGCICIAIAVSLLACYWLTAYLFNLCCNLQFFMQNCNLISTPSKGTGNYFFSHKLYFPIQMQSDFSCYPHPEKREEAAGQNFLSHPHISITKLWNIFCWTIYEYDKYDITWHFASVASLILFKRHIL